MTPKHHSRLKLLWLVIPTHVVTSCLLDSRSSLRRLLRPASQSQVSHGVVRLRIRRYTVHHRLQLPQYARVQSVVPPIVCTRLHRRIMVVEVDLRKLSNFAFVSKEKPDL